MCFYKPFRVSVMQSMTDEQLMAMSVQGMPDSFNEIVRRYSPHLLRFVRAGVANLQDAEDIVQETFLRAYGKRERFNSRYSLKCWLFTIAHRCRISFLRRQRPEASQAYPGDETSPSPLATLIQQQEMSLLWHEAGRLPKDQFTVLWLRYQEAMDIAQVARVMGKSRVHIRVLLHRARQALSLSLQSDGEPGSHRGVCAHPQEQNVLGADT
jgi:RNA polymerase sigma-70 factor (ECF subfamily)